MRADTFNRTVKSAADFAHRHFSWGCSERRRVHLPINISALGMILIVIAGLCLGASPQKTSGKSKGLSPPDLPAQEVNGKSQSSSTNNASTNSSCLSLYEAKIFALPLSASTLTNRVNGLDPPLDPPAAVPIYFTATSSTGNFDFGTPCDFSGDESTLPVYPGGWIVWVTIPSSTDNPIQVSVDDCKYAIDNVLAIVDGPGSTTVHQYLAGSASQNVFVYNRDGPVPPPMTITNDTTFALFNWDVAPNPASLHMSWKPVGVKIRVDANRDGTIAFDDDSDKTTPDKPFRFWLNDDHDAVVDRVAQSVQPTASNADDLHNQIANTRDLEDFTRIHIKAPSSFDPKDSSYEVKLQFTDVAEGSPAVNLWRTFTPGLEYLTDPNVAQQMLTLTNPARITSSQETAIPNDLFDNADKVASILFEGADAGKGALTVRLYKNGKKLGEDHVDLDLKTITRMYEHWTVGDTDESGVAIEGPHLTQDCNGGYTAQSPENPDYILFVHGWRMQPWERRAFANTAYKRLWHQGYKGRFGLFSWPTEYTTFGLNLISRFVRQNYDRSEWQAWKSAGGLRSVLHTLNAQYPGQVRMFAHSMGNIVASEALNLEAHSAVPQALVQTYVATQAASVAHAYDNDPNDVPVNFTAKPIYPNLYGFYPFTNHQPYFHDVKPVAGDYINFFNPADYALETGFHGLTWEFNQHLKPASGYSYVPHGKKTGWYHHRNLLPLPQDIYEVFAFADPARSRALGAQAGVMGPFDIRKQIDLQAAFGFQDSQYEHSAEFNYDFILRAPYWKILMKNFKLDTILN